MSAEIIPFDFEEQAVRVVMRGDDPWFVAADVCRVLELGNPTETLKRLDDDEVTLSTIEGSHRPTNLINESGLYALVLTSRKEAARRFRKWITAEVLPAIRRHGRYELTPPPEPEAGQIAGLPIREAELWLQMVREARLTRGTRAATAIWDRSPLPSLAPLAATRAGATVADGQGCLAHLLAVLGDDIAEARLMEAEHPALTAQGLRPYEAALFVANFALPLFDGTEWARGLHRSALLALPMVQPAPTSRTLGGAVTRGVLVPWRLIDGEGL
jgi:prophage antirepressor-like protein